MRDYKVELENLVDDLNEVICKTAIGNKFPDYIEGKPLVYKGGKLALRINPTDYGVILSLEFIENGVSYNIETFARIGEDLNKFYREFYNRILFIIVVLSGDYIAIKNKEFEIINLINIGSLCVLTDEQFAAVREKGVMHYQ